MDYNKYRSWLNEEKAVTIDNYLAVIKSGGDLNLNYVLVDVGALKRYCEEVIDNYKINGLEPNITRKELIDNNAVVSALKIAENTDELKNAYGTCMNASHVKVSAVNTNLKGKGYGRMLYKIVLSAHPEGLTPDRDFVSGHAFKAWQQMSKELSVKKVRDPKTDKIIDKFDNIDNPKTATDEDDCVIHTRDEYADMSVLDRAYTYSGADAEGYLSRGEQLLNDCEKILEGNWPAEMLRDLIADAGMTLYDMSIGYEGSINEAKLGKIWRRRAKARAKRNERQYPNKVDRSWALKQQEKWNKEDPELEQEYLKEIESASALVKSTNGYLNKLKELRKKKLEAKFNNRPKGNKKKKTLPNPYEGEKVTKNYPFDPGRTGGVAKVYQRRMKKAGGATAAPGEAFGPMEEQETNHTKEKGDGNTTTNSSISRNPR